MRPAPSEVATVEDEFSALLAAYDETLGRGGAEASTISMTVPDAIRPRFDQAAACLRLLRDSWSIAEATIETTEPYPASPGDEPDSGAHRLRQIGRFEIIGELGRGGGGVVLLAIDPVLKRRVALKIPRPEALDTPGLRARFLTEARTAAALEHPNIVPVFEADEAGPVCYLASAYCEGDSLSAWIKGHDGPIDPRTAARLMLELAGAIQHAHDRGVLHRDLKPGNVLLRFPEALTPDGPICPIPFVTDFGLAKLIEQDSSATRFGVPLGSPSYMAPEQARGQLNVIGPATDVYGLGAILYELLTRRPPFLGRTTHQTIEKVLEQELVPPRRIEPSVPRDLETICLKCLRKDPEDRYPTAAALADDLRAFLAGEAIHAVPEAWYRPLLRRARRSPALVVNLALTAIVISALSLYWRNRGNEGGASTPPVPGPPTPRRVWLDSRPSGARVVLVPLDPTTGEPQPDRALPGKAGGTTPITLDAMPGLYFVEVEKPGHGFHQVYRRVPGFSDQRGVYQHTRWETRADGTLELPTITIPDASVVKGMVRIEGMEDFLVRMDSRDMPARHERVPAYYLDPTEVTVRQYRDVAENLTPRLRELESPPSDSEPIRFITFDEASHYAERMGKRLPTETEYEYVATGGGTRKFPWGDSDKPLRDHPWKFGPVGEPAFDRTETNPPIFGLYSNVAEWTTSWAASRLSPRVIAEELLAQYRDARIARGGTLSVIRGHPDLDELLAGPRARSPLPRLPDPSAPGLGFRCARSARPVYLANGREAGRE